MNRQHYHRKPDFFAVVLVLVILGFGLTLAVQVSVADRHQVVDSEVVKVLPKAG
ncbi:MAG: hypothetical protein KZQ99_14665 [Candidatus Thiodiazotropha sp. (ex Dulcina madagascariensis)]|nr:hypothetical protein [Candidatus Thiodiazotropha sp. (ex Epidulcina cf. delphinae)]MCU7921370.1 hypothetical protein [Candidatus Thiodiazotropha sp. (ex Dulcina madagascariensis)]MCU7926196.1 hypothetical protein [Candidatus Thiodiazotropha sp. (ex Dulcina madagascariensis)]MCU7936096.1 hypothetical protein [Candidatus Thiodiazotropha sp. (ex Dulcina madagascariensis)]